MEKEDGLNHQMLRQTGSLHIKTFKTSVEASLAKTHTSALWPFGDYLILFISSTGLQFRLLSAK